MKPHVQVTEVMRASNLLYVYARIIRRSMRADQFLYVFYVLQYMNGHAVKSHTWSQSYINVMSK